MNAKSTGDEILCCVKKGRVEKEETGHGYSTVQRILVYGKNCHVTTQTEFYARARSSHSLRIKCLFLWLAGYSLCSSHLSRKAIKVKKERTIFISISIIKDLSIRSDTNLTRLFEFIKKENVLDQWNLYPFWLWWRFTETDSKTRTVTMVHLSHWWNEQLEAKFVGGWRCIGNASRTPFKGVTFVNSRPVSENQLFFSFFI